MAFRACAVVPVFNQHDRVVMVVSGLVEQGLSVIIVDDGSDAATHRILGELAQSPEIECLTLPTNRGKGAAVMAGFVHAEALGFTHVLQMDADGQHDVHDVAALLGLAAAHPEQLISGMPRYDDSVPAVRFYGRYLTHVLIWLDTLSLSLRDSMCGFRVYPLMASLALMRQTRIGERMDFDTDIMTRLFWAGTESLFVSTRVSYPPDGSSNFRMLRDNLRMTWLHLRLFAGMWPRLPSLLRRSLHRPGAAAHWARIAERGSAVGIGFVGAVDRVLGRTACCVVLTPVVLYFMAVHGKARRASRKFLQAAGLPPTAANRFRQLMNFAISTLDKVRAWHCPADIDVDMGGCRAIHERVVAGQGLLLLTAHLGNAEALRAMTATGLVPRRVNALVYSNNSVIFNAMLKATNDEYPLDLIQVDAMGVDTAMALRERVAAGEIVVMAGDRTPVSNEGPTATANFLGEAAPFAMGPYILAHLLECPVYLFFGIRTAHGYKIYAEAFAERVRLPRAGRQAAANTWATRYAERLAEYARRFPLQWYNFYDFWAANDAMSRTVQEPAHARRTA